MTDLFAVETRADERAAVKLAANNKLTVACYVKRQLIGNICAIERQSLGNDRAERKLFRLFVMTASQPVTRTPKSPRRK